MISNHRSIIGPFVAVIAVVLIYLVCSLAVGLNDTACFIDENICFTSVKAGHYIFGANLFWISSRKHDMT